jgi:hypothetical protein
MANFGDHDGKSKTASAVDQNSYPEMNETPNHPVGHAKVERAPTHAEIAKRAYEIWLEQGSPDNVAERNWIEAQQQLQSGGDTENLLHNLHEKAGSVQR